MRVLPCRESYRATAEPLRTQGSTRWKGREMRNRFVGAPSEPFRAAGDEPPSRSSTCFGARGEGNPGRRLHGGRRATSPVSGPAAHLAGVPPIRRAKNLPGKLPILSADAGPCAAQIRPPLLPCPKPAHHGDGGGSSRQWTR